VCGGATCARAFAQLHVEVALAKSERDGAQLRALALVRRLGSEITVAQ
jgi:hypothetical protein